MEDDVFKNIAKMLSAELPIQIKKKSAIVDELNFKYARTKNYGSEYVNEIGEIYKTSLNEWANQIYETIVSNIFDPEISSPGLNSNLEKIFKKSYYDYSNFVKTVTIPNYLKKWKDNEQMVRKFKSISLEFTDQVNMNKYEGKIKIHCDKLALEKQKIRIPATGIHVIGHGNIVQSGQGNNTELAPKSEKREWTLTPMFWLTVGILVLTAILVMYEYGAHNEKENPHSKDFPPITINTGLTPITEMFTNFDGEKVVLSYEPEPHSVELTLIPKAGTKLNLSNYAQYMPRGLIAEQHIRIIGKTIYFNDKESTNLDIQINYFHDSK